MRVCAYRTRSTPGYPGPCNYLRRFPLFCAAAFSVPSSILYALGVSVSLNFKGAP